MVEQLVRLSSGEGEEPLLQLPRSVVSFIRKRPEPPLFNAYICRRRKDHLILTIDVHSGVTPMMLSCRDPHCDTFMISAGYPNDGHGPVPDHLRDKPVWEWFRPDEDAFRKMEPEMRGHIMQGGLELRKFDGSLAEWEAARA